MDDPELKVTVLPEVPVEPLVPVVLVAPVVPIVLVAPVVPVAPVLPANPVVAELGVLVMPVDAKLLVFPPVPERWTSGVSVTFGNSEPRASSTRAAAWRYAASCARSDWFARTTSSSRLSRMGSP